MEKKINDNTIETKRIDIPNTAKMEIARINQNMNNYIAGVVAGLGIEDKWTIDMKTMQFIVENK